MHVLFFLKIYTYVKVRRVISEIARSSRKKVLKNVQGLKIDENLATSLSSFVRKLYEINIWFAFLIFIYKHFKFFFYGINLIDRIALNL